MEREIKKNIHVGVALMDNLFDTLIFSTHTSFDIFLVKCKYNSIKPRSYYPCFIITYKNYFTYRYNEPLSQLQSILTLKQNRKCIVYITILINMSFFINSFFKLPCLPVFILPIVSFYFIYNALYWLGSQMNHLMYNQVIATTMHQITQIDPNESTWTPMCPYLI